MPNIKVGDIVWLERLQANKFDSKFINERFEVIAAKGYMITAKSTKTGRILTRNVAKFKKVVR